ncbi:MAG: ABC transporter permease [Actinomycetales bacterium]|nr:ABC transporter permease [Actinomycetales bacterium]
MNQETNPGGTLSSDLTTGRASGSLGAGGTATALTSDASLGVSHEAGGRKLRFPETGALLIFLAVLLIVFALLSDVFLTYDNLINVLVTASVPMILAVPATMLLISGQFDLSIGGGVALITTIFAWSITNAQFSTPVAVLIAVAAGLAIGVLNGFLVTVVGINALITTLGTLAIFRGLSLIITEGLPIQINGFNALGIDRPFLNITWSTYIFIAITLLAIFVLRSTVYGRTLYAIGANPVAARLAGIRVNNIIFITFIVSGLAVALAGLITSSYTGQGSGQNALGLELQVITAVILGGASLAGGRGAILGTLLGVLILGIINNGLTLLNVQSFWQDVARGSLLILAVSIDVLRLRLASRSG